MILDQPDAILHILFANVALGTSSDSLVVIGVQLPIPQIIFFISEYDEIHGKTLLSMLPIPGGGQM